MTVDDSHAWPKKWSCFKKEKKKKKLLPKTVPDMEMC